MNLSVAFSVLVIALILLTLLGFAIRVVGGVFSPEIRKKIRAHPLLHFLWFLLCLVIIFLVITQVHPMPTRINEDEKIGKKVAFGWFLVNDSKVSRSDFLVSPPDLA